LLIVKEAVRSKILVFFIEPCVDTSLLGASHHLKLERRYKMRTKFLFVFLLLGAFLSFIQPAGAGTVGPWPLNAVISGDTPGSTAPYGTIEFDDGGTPGSVTVTMTASLEAITEFFGEWFFNYAGDASALTYTYQGNSTGPEASSITFNQSFEGDGVFDVRFGWTPIDDFDNFDVVVYEITDTNIVAADFDYASTGRRGGYNTGAKVQGILLAGDPLNDPSGSSSTAFIPIPGSALLLAPGLILLVAVRRKFRSKS
jgi:hypothetical protein